jgi:hypothetical protein
VAGIAKGQRKDDLNREYLRRAERDDRGLVPAQVLYVGVAQEKQKVFRTVKRRNPDASWAIEKATAALSGVRALLAESPPERFS